MKGIIIISGSFDFPNDDPTRPPPPGGWVGLGSLRRRPAHPIGEFSLKLPAPLPVQHVFVTRPAGRLVIRFFLSSSTSPAGTNVPKKSVLAFRNSFFLQNHYFLVSTSRWPRNTVKGFFKKVFSFSNSAQGKVPGF